MLAHKARCRELPPLRESEVAAMVAAFAERGGQVQQCRPACVLPVQNGAGLVSA